MRAIDALAAQAVVGTERQPLALPEVPGPVGELVTAVASSAEAAPSLLRAAGIVDLCAGVGYRPAPFDPSAPAPCDAEQLRVVNDRAVEELIVEILDGDTPRLRAEALRVLAQHGCCLPFRVMPRALEAARRTAVLRPFLMPVLGERGAWLARQNRAWAYAAGARDDDPIDHSVWDTGNVEQRLAYLRRLRGIDPSHARCRLAQEFAELGARERALFVGAMAVGVGPADEPFLEAALGDRAKDTRRAVADVLAALPDSAYCARMTARLSPCLAEQRKLLRAAWVLEPPGDFAADWKSDAIDESRPQGESLGNRAFWLMQIVRAVPLAWWTAHTGLAPAELLAWSRKSGWHEALVRGWHQALVRTPVVEWVEAFLADPPQEANLVIDPFALIAALPAARREPHWVKQIEAADRALGPTLAAMLDGMPLDAPPLSPRFARKLIALAKDRLQGDEPRWDAALRAALPELACVVPLELLDEMAQGWTTQATYMETIARVRDVVRRRASLHARFSTPGATS